MITFEKKLLIGAVGFMLFIIFLVIACMKQDYFLVAKDYYRQEINYQKHIDKVSNAQSLQKAVDFENQATAGYVKLHFPHLAEKNGELQGKIIFFRPSDARKDIVIPINLTQDYHQIVDVRSLDKGLWKVKVDWVEMEEAYYNEFTLIMP